MMEHSKKHMDERPLKTGNEQFTICGEPVGFSVLDFWRFSYSELNSDPRDDIAEYLVSMALGVMKPYNKRNWTLFDIDYNGAAIEVKSTSYFQTWREDGKVSQQRSFSIRKAKADKDSDPKHHSDVYVFCLLNGNTEDESDPLKLENWKFYIVPTVRIDAECGEQKTISLNRLKKMGISGVPYTQIKQLVDEALAESKAREEN